MTPAELLHKDAAKYATNRKLAYIGLMNKKEVDHMTIRDYIDSTIILNEVLKLWHAPYLNHDE